MIITDRNILSPVLRAAKTGGCPVVANPSEGFVELYADARSYSVSRVIHTAVDPSLKRPFAISVEALQRIFKAAPKGREIRIEIDGSTTPPTCIARAGAGRFEIPVSTCDPVVDPRVVGDLRAGVSADNLKALRGVIMDALPMMSTDITRSLHAIRIDAYGDGGARAGVRAIATDGHRVAVIGGASERVYGGVEPKASAILSGVIAPMMGEALSRATSATVESDDRTSRVSIRDGYGWVTFAAGIGRAGSFPSYIKAIPGEGTRARSVSAAAEDLLRAIGEVEPFAIAPYNAVRVTLGPESITIAAKGEIGRASSDAPATVSDGRELAPICIDARYFREAIKAVSGDQGRVSIHLLSSPIDPVTIVSGDGEDMVVVMPMRI